VMTGTSRAQGFNEETPCGFGLKKGPAIHA
jgi:hypothetical protein